MESQKGKKLGKKIVTCPFAFLFAFSICLFCFYCALCLLFSRQKTKKNAKNMQMDRTSPFFSFFFAFCRSFCFPVFPVYFSFVFFWIVLICFLFFPFFMCPFFSSLLILRISHGLVNITRAMTKTWRGYRFIERSYSYILYYIIKYYIIIYTYIYILEI